MKNIMKMTAFATVTMFLFTFGLCDTVIPNVVDEIAASIPGSYTMVARATPIAGKYTVPDKSIKNNFREFVIAKGIDTNKIVSVTIFDAQITIPAASSLTYADVDSVNFFLGGNLLLGYKRNAGVITGTAQSQKSLPMSLSPDNKTLYFANKYVSPFETGLVRFITSAPELTYKSEFFTNKATPRTELTLTYKIHIVYTL